MKQTYQKLCFCLALMLAFALNAVAGIEVSQTLPSSGTPEHRYTMMNAQGYYCNATMSPTKNSDNYAQFAFYASKQKDAFYVYNVTAKKWVTYKQEKTYSPKTGFVKFSDTQDEASIFKFNNLGGAAYDIQPYTTSGVAAIYLNWYKGVGGSDNPEDGKVTLGLWTDSGSDDNGSNWTFKEVGVKHKYTLFSDGMPSSAVVVINGTEFRGLNAQGDQSIEVADLEAKDVVVKVGGGYLAKVTIDNANYQVDVKFIQFFIPTASVDAEKQYPYLLHMPAAYVKKTGDNLLFTKKRGEADKFLFVEKEQGQYYIYDQTAKGYIYYTSTNNGSTAKATANSNVRFTTDATVANTWQLLFLSEETAAIIPGSISNPSLSSASLNFTGGIAGKNVLNLWSARDANSAWEIIDPTAGSMPCATLMYALPGAPYIHKLVVNEGETVTSVDFGNISTLSLKSDRAETGNKYKYVAGTAPSVEGEYSYMVNLTTAGGEATQVKVRLVVSNHLQSPTPMMAWLTWNWFARAISHDKMVAIAEGMQKHGLIDAGFTTIVLDDAWAAPTTDKSALTYDAQKFPKGISGLKDALRKINNKLKVGIYSDAGSMTCENYQPGSYGYEAAHVALFDSWGVDMLKYDYCNSQASTKVSYSQMGEAIAKLNETRKANGTIPFVFNICEWGKTQPWLWGAEAGGSSWRATSDAREDWMGNNSRPGVIAGVDEVRRLWMYAGVNRFNDLDMMCIGLHGLGGPSNNTANHQSNGGKITGLTDAQARTQMSLWCMFASPLALTCDLRETPKGEANSGQKMPNPLITKADIETLTNAEILAINQDALGQQAEYMETISTGKQNYSSRGYDVYVKDLTDGRMAVSVTNRGTSSVNVPALQLTSLYLKANTKYACHEVWSKDDQKVENTLNVGTLKPCETKVYVLPPESDPSSIGQVSASVDHSNTPSYDLSGRRVSEDHKGITIKNGVKSIKF